jgi:predicted nuclease with TOPRIM domain
MDPELIAYLDERFRESSRQIQDLGEENSQRFDQVDKRLDQMDEQLRLTDVKVEDLRGKTQLVAEGVAAVDEKLKSFRETVALEFQGVRLQYDMYIDDLNRRVRDLELRQPKAS